ncbi:hypothetical protein B7494_g2379 [Chlorociboria aeruginascens]|nr:hypothetical protein B7494_g2379 [Chlorociboria aeruginascens]
MGVPALFRWLSQKYPKIVSPVIEEQPREIDGQIIPIDTRGPNPNNEEFDNLYLDMNGIVHPCSHPEDRPAPKDEEEMMLEIFKYTDRVVNMVRPRKLLMIAIDGVAPRAKMNQQRSRRFRSAQEAKEKEEDKATLLKMLKSQGGHVEEPVIKKAWDSNEITPGTPFMDILAASLRYWIALKLNTDPAWAKMKVIISDSTVPGEGEHKIMEFIRSQRSSPEHDPNTKHVIYGLDADLIMLGLGTHEPHFRVLREDVFAQDSKPRTCHLCGQAGHEARECTGEAKVKDGDFDEKDSAPALKPFIWLHVSILREYLAAELYVPSQPFRFDLERAIDDWVFMCFFVGNDFLPHLPSLEIRENGIDTLIAIWRDNIPYMGGYLTKDGHVDLERAQFILDGLAKQEDAIFRRRKQTEERREAGAKRRKLESERGGRGGRGGGRGGFQGSPTNGRKSSQVSNGPEGLPLFAPGDITKEAKLMTHDMVVNRGAIYKANLANKSAAAALKSQISGQGYTDETSPKGNLIESPASALGKRKADLVEDDDISSTPGRTTPNPGTPSPSDEPAIDIVRLWDEGYADRYYESKFHVDPRDLEFRHKVGRAYVEGLAWVLLYYFQGCPSWDWYYPYHYAPFAADFVNIADVKLRFEKGQIFRPFEQLMGVLPAASRQAIPEIFHDLMTSPDSEIIDFYPEDFTVDLNGKKFAWQGVALLPFIDSRRLLDAMAKRYPLLPPDVAARNGVGKDVLLVAEAHTKLYDDIATNFYSKKKGEGVLKLNPRSSEGLTGGSSRGMKPVVETAGSWKSLAYGGHSIAHLRGTHHGFRYKCGEFLVDLLSVLSSKPEAHIAYRIPTIAARYLGLWPDLFTAMNGDLNLVVSLVDRLTTRLPHRTGSYSTDLYRDELVVLTRATLVNVSTSTIGVVVETIVRLLEDISRPYKGLITHPLHVAHSELFILGLLADCCSTHWASLNTAENDTPEDSEEFDSEGSDESGNGSQKNGPHRKSNGKPKKEPRNGPQTRKIPPVPLDDDLAIRLLDIVKLFSNPVPENYVLPASNILDDAIWGAPIMDIAPIPESIINSSGDRQNDLETPNLLKAKADIIESYSRTILEYISCSNWSRVLEYLRQALRGLRGNPALDDTSALVTIRLISCFWVDSRKLTNIIQELCGSFLHLRKAFQTTVAIALPLLITRWLERNPEEFIELHTMHKRLDGGADTLFDMAQTMIDSSRRRSLLFLFQTSLLFLLPDVFEVASNMRDAKSSNISKKVQFLEMLRKALRSRNESAIYCLVAILRVARHFPLNSDAALLSYALDVQDEIREAVFRKSAAGVEISPVDRGLITATFVSLVHLNFESAVETLTPSCLTQKSSPDFQIAAISACTHFTKQPNSSDYAPLYDKVMGFVQKQLLQPSVNSRDSFPDEQYTISASRLDVLTAIFMFLEASAVNFGRRARASDWRDISEGRNELFIDYMRHEDDHIRLLAQTVALRLMKEGVVSYCASGQNVDIALLKSNFWKSTSTALISLSEYLLEGRGDEKSKLNFIHDYIKARFEVLKEVEELVDSDDEFTERANASAGLETCFLVALCSADISHCQVVTRCISVFCDETQYIDSRAGSGKHSQYTLRNIDVYRELASREFRFTGLVAFQKRVRGLLRQMEYPTAGILTAWEVIFEKWLKISRQVFANPSETVDEKTLVEWRNFSGFLASLGGTCMSDSNITMDEPGLAGLKWVDRLSTDSHDDTILSRYMKQSIQLLASSNVRIRESTREVLSSDLSKALYMPLFESLEAELEALFDSSRANAAASIEARLIFAEQAASVLKGIVDKLGGPTEVGTGLVIDIGALTLNFAKFLNDLPEIGSTLRVKIKICQLCETVTQKKELLNLRHDVRIRNQLLEVIFRWIARPSSPKIDNSVLQANNRADEFFRLQRDLDRASLKALADLTYRLPLQPAEGQTDADTSDLKGQMFQTYFNRFLSLLNYETNEITRNEVRLVPGTEEYISTSEYAIVALSNLLSANIDVGLKLSLSIGYAEDLDIRTAFVKVLCNILIQGTEFNNLSDASVNQKYDALLELLVNDMALTIALCDACPSSEVDEMTISLLNIFDSRGLGFALLEALIEHEVDETENEAELLRRNCVATKMLSVYARWKGQAYLKTTLQTVIERLIMAAKDLDLELDPARTSSAEELRKNSVQLRVVTRVFVEDICASADNIPVSFRKICSIISSAVMKRFPEAKFTAVGAFIFLRFFCPAIVAPDVEGLTATTPSKEMRRGLLLIAKVVQNLANNVLFGAKEPYMFPLNDFLTENIYRVTTFLREISVLEPISETESFDFGSCVALHRFLYDHWDHVRQKLVLRERKLSVRSKREIPTGQTPILEFLRKLISNLGPPPMDVSWNRPTIVSNTPPSYSRFQHFMLRNAGRSTESVISSRAVYDGGESKDGLSMICIILRNIDTENTDYDLLLYVYLKIASRMWHRPFGILIDATCYNGQNEPQDALFRKLDLLTPSELTKQLSRIYVYNMNSAFRKCFRRILRLSAKSDNSAFHPKNVDYHLLGNLQDLQTHFHLSQLHLPKETISVVTDTRFVFQPIVRLSKTKGKIDVLIKVGSQFVQVTTMKKQEVVLGLRLHATVNDIFRLSEVEEAPTSIQTEDDSAFGLRTENGKIVMYFTSSRKADVLQSIRTAKLKFGKELKTLRSFERLVRPQDVPGTLLNIALTNMASSDQVLRLASYNLLCALCRAFNFTTDSKFMSTKELCVPMNPSHFIIDISQQLAQSEPQLTADFLNEFFVGWEFFPYSQRPLSLTYMAPWLPGLRTSLIATDADGDKAREKVASIFRKLIDVAISDVTLSTTLEQNVWPAIARDEIYNDIFLEEVVKTALGFGIDDYRTEILGSIIASLGIITIRGRLLSRLRKALNRTSLRPTRYLPENTVWNEICVLLRLCLSTSFDSRAQSQLYLPELFHLVTMLANTGSHETRLLVHRLLVNTVHAIYTNFPLEDSQSSRLKVLLMTISEPRNDTLFNSSTREGSMTSTLDLGVSALAATEALAVLLSEISVVAAPSIDMSNAWRSRWMSLVASTAFQSNYAIQPRAFTVMGCLAREEVDDDLLYQVLVALRNSIARFVEDNDPEMLISIVSSLTKMMDKLPTTSRYALQLFWLAISLVRLVPLPLFNTAAMFVSSVVLNISTSGDFQNGKMAAVLINGRSQIEDATLQIDELYGVHFSLESFHCAIIATLVKGLTDPITRDTTQRTISTFLKITAMNMAPGLRFPNDPASIPYLALLITRSITKEESLDHLWLSGMNPIDIGEDPIGNIDLDRVRDKELLLLSAITMVDFKYLEEGIQLCGLTWLNSLAIRRPTVALHLASPILAVLESIIMSCQNPRTLESAHVLLRTITGNEKFATVGDTEDLVGGVLEEIGFGGLWRSSSFHFSDGVRERARGDSASDNQSAKEREGWERATAALIDRLIELPAAAAPPPLLCPLHRPPQLHPPLHIPLQLLHTRRGLPRIPQPLVPLHGDLDVGVPRPRVGGARCVVRVRAS